MLKLSIITKTFRLHDNPFLDSDIYIILIEKKKYGKHQLNFLNNILDLHLKDLENINIKPILLTSFNSIKNLMKELNEDFEVYLDEVNPSMKIPFKYNYMPTWCLLDWSDKVDMLRMWFLPEALGNHKVFKKYAIENLRNIYESEPNNENKYNIKSKYSYKINKTCVPLPDNNLDSWIIERLNETNYMNDKKWYKPDTCPSTSIKDYSINLSGIHNTSKLSPFIALGVLSPLTAYNFYSDENRTGSSRDQLLFREMFHACAQMPEYWSVDFGKEYDWKTNEVEWNKYINGETGHEDLDWAMKQLKNEGWLHHLARHLVADYLTRGKLEIHWIHGANWFKENLVDHDDCVNRGNWMWLSGTAFSTKQRSFYHYNYDNYIKNRNKKLKIKDNFLE